VRAGQPGSRAHGGEKRAAGLIDMGGSFDTMQQFTYGTVRPWFSGWQMVNTTNPDIREWLLELRWSQDCGDHTSCDGVTDYAILVSSSNLRRVSEILEGHNGC